MDGNKTKICCVTGHRPSKFTWDYYDYNCRLHTDYLEAMASKVIKLIDEGVTDFICGGANGVDLDFADIVIGLRDSYCPHISSEVAVPYEGQSNGWNSEDKQRYGKMLEKADMVTCLQDDYSPGCLVSRNRYMVGKANVVLAFWNGDLMGGTYGTMQYAKSQGKNLIIVQIPIFAEGLN